jgi:hypothetical protein
MAGGAAIKERYVEGGLMQYTLVHTCQVMRGCGALAAMVLLVACFGTPEPPQTSDGVVESRRNS